MIRVVISQPMYFPWPGFFEQMKLADVYIWLDDAQYSKGSFTNRVQVLLAGKQLWMTVPLQRKTGCKIADLTAKGDNWKHSHRDLLLQCLQGVPYATQALALFDQTMEQADLNELLIASAETVAAALNAKPKQIWRASQLNIAGTGSQRILDIVLAVGGSRYLTGHGAANYLDHEAFVAAGVAVEYMSYNVKPWPQPGGGFTPYVTSLDLIARQGPEAGQHLAPATVSWQEFMEKKRHLEKRDKT